MDPDAIYVKLKYTLYYDDTGAVAKVNYIRGNGPYDPDNGIGGGQPVGFDQYTALYQKYKCFGSKVVLKYVNTGANVLEMVLTPKLVAANTAADPLTEAFCKWKLVPPSTTAGVRYLTGYMSTRKMYGTGSFDQSYESATNSLPVNQWFWMFYRADTALTTNVTGKCYAQVTYYCKFFQKQVINDV